ncbi:MAG: glycosyltransferase, partial [Sphingomicrobium sp.]
MTKPVRAILASEFWPGATASGIAPGLRETGWLVDEVDIQNFLPPTYSIPAKIEARLRRRFQGAAFQRAILRSVQIHQPSVFLTVKGYCIDPPCLAAMRRDGVLLVNYYPDYHFNDVSLDQLTLYDLVITTKSFQLARLAKVMPPANVAFVHHGYSADLHRPIVTADPPINDILYVGNATPTKAKLMIAVAEALPEATIRVVGHRWMQYAVGTALEKSVVGTAITGDYYADEIARARVVLAFHMGVDSNTGFEDLVSTRSFEIPACGGFMLHIDNDEIRSLYDVPSEIDTFR